MPRTLLLIITLFALSNTASANTTPEFMGQATPISPEILQIEIAPEPIDEQAILQLMNEAANDFDLADIIFPLETSLTPGRVSLLDNQANIDGSLFVIGSDTLSLQWLQDNIRFLMDINARGIVVQAQSSQDMANIRAHSEHLMITMGDGDGLIQTFGLSSYPALITSQVIE